MFRLTALLPLAAAAIVIAAPVQAQPERPFTTAALKAAQAQGRPILIDVFAPWCPVCRAQAPTIDALTKDPKYKDVVIFRLDYDSQKDEKQALAVRQQSTLIAFKGGRETGRLVGETNPYKIKALAASTLN